MKNLKIPVGRSGFADIRKNQYYFVDKSGLIEELLRTDATQVEFPRLNATQIHHLGPGGLERRWE